MHRTSLLVLTTLLLGGAALLSCNDRSGPPSEVDRSLVASGEAENDIQRAINALFGKPGGQLTSANQKWKNIQKACPPGAQTTPLDCQTQVFDFIDLINQKAAQGKLKTAEPPVPDPQNEIPNTLEGAIAYLQILLLQYAGFDIESDVEGGDPEQRVVVVCNPGAPCPVFVPNPDGNPHSGAFLPDGACDGRCAVTGQKLDETQFFPGDGPLPTPFDQFPFFFDWSKHELGEAGGPSSGLALAQGEFNVPVEFALCVVTDGPYAPSVPVSQLVLAHPDPDNPETIETFEQQPAPNVPLDCSDATTGDPPGEPIGSLTPAGRQLGLAGGTKASSSISSFTPWAAVDPESGEPGSIAGTVSDFCFGGGISGAFVELFEGTIDVEEVPIATTFTEGTSGSYGFADVPVGDYTVRASEEGYNSNTATATVSSGEESTANIQLTPTSGCIG
jgi:hypothetical protein